MIAETYRRVWEKTVIYGAVISKLISCEFNMDTNCVEMVYSDGKMVSIDTISVEIEYAEDIYQHPELDWLIC